jgi:N6-adenosine-specific RNA methylase IME4
MGADHDSCRQARTENDQVMTPEPWPFGDLEPGKYGAILADPPWHFQSWAGGRKNGDKSKPVFTPARAPDYATMREPEMTGLPLGELAADDAVLFLWTCWPVLEQSLRLLPKWGFVYKTCAFAWIKANVRQIDMFRDDADPDMLLGYWTRANSEICLLATRGKPKRLNADVRQGIIAPRREHSRKPDGIHERIERLVSGPYVELFARQRRPGWDAWGNETDKYAAAP